MGRPTRCGAAVSPGDYAAPGPPRAPTPALVPPDGAMPAEAEPAGGRGHFGAARPSRGGAAAPPAEGRCEVAPAARPAAPCMSGDVSLHLSPVPLACPAVKTGGVFFIPAHKVPKGKGALMPVFGHKQLSLIIVFLLSLPVPLESQQMSMP